MKKIFLTLTFILTLFLSSVPKQISFALTKETYYAKVESESVFLYSLPINSSDYKMFEIPASYFVLLSASENEYFYKAKYSDIEGYVLKNSVTPINETPNYPFAMASFRIKSFYGLPMYSLPNKNGEEVAIIPSNETVSTYYGKIDGEELVENTSTKQWYYCSYLKDGTKFNGYVFSYYCDNFQKPQLNTESYTKVPTEIFIPKDDPLNESQGLSATAKALIAISCSIPCLVILILLLKRKATDSRQTKKIVRKPRRDYYEFNEDDI